VTVYSYTILVYNQHFKPTQPCALSGWEMSTGHGAMAAALSANVTFHLSLIFQVADKNLYLTMNCLFCFVKLSACTYVFPSQSLGVILKLNLTQKKQTT